MDTDYPGQQLAANVEAAFYCDAQDWFGFFDFDLQGSSNLKIGFARGRRGTFALARLASSSRIVVVDKVVCLLLHL